MERLNLIAEPPGYGDGYGSGDGSGYGSGYGDGYGDGYGSGDGSGYGDGYGYGDGSLEYWREVGEVFAATLTREQRSRAVALKSEGATFAFWRSDADGRPANGGHMDPATPGAVQTLGVGRVELCSGNALHATLMPPAWNGERLWLVALIGDVAYQAEGHKLGARTREIIGECR